VLGLIGVGKQGVSAAVERVRHLLRADVSRDVCAAHGGRAGPGWLKIAALSSFCPRSYSSRSRLPIVQVESRLAFAAKISGVIVIANAIGAGIFLRFRLVPQSSAGIL
jgi:hypothetical protein